VFCAVLGVIPQNGSLDFAGVLCGVGSHTPQLLVGFRWCSVQCWESYTRMTRWISLVFCAVLGVIHQNGSLDFAGVLCDVGSHTPE
jgi:hypothetical protein